MEVTVVKKLNGIAIHPAYTTDDGQEVPLKITGEYKFDVPELGFRDRRYVDLIPHIPSPLKDKIEQLLVKAQEIVAQQ